jgi:hypothetical protein
MIPVGLQTREAEVNGLEVVEMEAGHCPFTTQPRAFVDVVQKILDN